MSKANKDNTHNDGDIFINFTPTGVTQQTAAGAGAAVKVDSTSTGGIGSTAYTVGDVIAALKTMGVLKT
jgi:hypothetical protein